MKRERGRFPLGVPGLSMSVFDLLMTRKAKKRPWDVVLSETFAKSRSRSRFKDERITVRFELNKNQNKKLFLSKRVFILKAQKFETLSIINLKMKINERINFLDIIDQVLCLI